MQDDDEEEEAERDRIAEAMRLAQSSVAFDPDAPEFEPPPTSAAPAKPTDDATAPAADAKPKRVRKNKPKFKKDGGSNVYVSGIPPSTDDDALAECFKVAGLLKTDPESGKPRIKRYVDEQGRPKGDALITFLKPESVALAVTLRDGFELEAGVTLSVAPAKFELRGEPRLQPKRLGKEAVQLRKKQKLLEERQLAQWEDALLTATDGKRQSTVILLGLFTVEEVEAADAHFYANLKQDVEVESKKAGEIEKVTIFEGSERGVAAVRFKHPDDAERCVAMLTERSFGSSQLKCELFDGVSDYRAKPTVVAQGSSEATGQHSGTAESVDEQERNLEGFADWLEADSTDEEIDANEED